ncbi:MAG: osmotically inducible protein C [Bacteroidetes bacterium]|nr:MAG: osmotically inducible protein C [Bacteroidota bacterium]
MNTSKVTFVNKQGHKLAARLELPMEQKPKAFTLFAHCFTCNKNLNAVRHISNALTQQGFGVLRFDFTGLGESEGDFEDTNFSSNVSDLVAAADYLSQEYEAPKLIIGHSLGGAAALFAGAQVDSIEAIATIGAPASPEHISHLFSDHVDEIKQHDSVEVMLSGRPFTIKKQFLEDVNTANMTAVLDNLRKPLLILHSPQDNTVGIENAGEIYSKATHPKSFISLDGADHLLSQKEDSIYAGSTIANWASRYIKIPSEKKLETDYQVLTRIGGSGYTTQILAGKHHLIADEPEAIGGDDFGTSPYGLLLASLGSCTAITMRMYADRKGWPIEEINVHLSHSKDYAKDCEECEISKAKIDIIDRKIEVKGDLDEGQMKRMMIIADKCPVHRTLHNQVQVRTSVIH